MHEANRLAIDCNAIRCNTGAPSLRERPNGGGRQVEALGGRIWQGRLTVELSGAHADVWAWHFIFHASAPAIC